MCTGRLGKSAYWIGTIVFVLAVRVALYLWSQEDRTDFDLLYHAAIQLLQGSNPYRHTGWYPLYYPIPAVLLAVPFTALPLNLARPAFDILVGSVFAYALTKHSKIAPLALLSGAYLYAMRNGQTTPLIMAAGLIPFLSFLLVVKPNTGLVLWSAYPRWEVLTGIFLLTLGMVFLPTWPLDWWQALHEGGSHIRPPILRPGGFLLLLAAFRWKTPGGRLLLATALIPQNTLPHELVPLALLPVTLADMGIYIVGTWVTVAVAASVQAERLGLALTVERVWPAILCCVYLPSLWMVLRPRAVTASPVEHPADLARPTPESQLA